VRTAPLFLRPLHQRMPRSFQLVAKHSFHLWCRRVASKDHGSCSATWTVIRKLAQPRDCFLQRCQCDASSRTVVPLEHRKCLAPSGSKTFAKVEWMTVRSVGRADARLSGVADRLPQRALRRALPPAADKAAGLMLLLEPPVLADKGNDYVYDVSA